MFCYQCEQTAKGTGCNVMGVCGKSAEVSDLQDLLIHAAKGIAMYAHRAFFDYWKIAVGFHNDRYFFHE